MEFEFLILSTKGVTEYLLYNKCHYHKRDQLQLTGINHLIL